MQTLYNISQMLTDII